jgi:nucleoside-diphosphate-sugar epimerase
MKVLITGAGGMLGQAVSPCLESRGHETIDLPRQRSSIRR